MKAKYKHYGNDCIIYNQVICDDNIVTEVETYVISWSDDTPKTSVYVCDDEREAINLYNDLCENLKNARYDCEYRY